MVGIFEITGSRFEDIGLRNIILCNIAKKKYFLFLYLLGKNVKVFVKVESESSVIFLH